MVLMVVVLVTLTGAWRPAGALNVVFDDRTDRTARPLGTAVVLGDSVGYGLVRALEQFGGANLPNLTGRLAADGWGPLRSYTLAGLHAAPEGAGDPYNVATWIGTFRAQGFQPRVAVILAGSNDVGWPQGGSVSRNMQRIETALRSLGTTEVVWTTITHANAAYESAWNAALRGEATRWPNLHVCEWQPVARSNPSYLSSDQVHPTPTGYRVLRDLIAGCVAQRGAQAAAVGGGLGGAIGASGVPGKLQAQAPVRVVDTRPGAAVAAGGTRRVHVAPAGTTAVALNLTAVGAMGAGYLTAYPCNQDLPGSSSLNYGGSAPVAAGVTVGVDPGGDVCVFSSATTHLLVDVQGAYRAGSGLGFAPRAVPARLADTRAGARLAPGAELRVDVGASGAWLNLTAVDPSGAGFLTVYPCGGVLPNVSNLNFVPGPQPVANAATVAAGPANQVCVQSSVPVHVIVDLSGGFGASGASFVPAAPTRVLDTRLGQGGWQGSVRAQQVIPVDLGANATVPAGATGVVATLTAIPDRSAWLVAYPGGQPQPATSNLNPAAWVPRANAVTVASRNVAIAMPTGHGYFLLDVTGWWQ